MGIKEDINKYVELITDVKKYRIYMTQIGQLEKQIRRYLKKEISGDRNIQFNSQDLRNLTIKLEKIHKSINKSISFMEMEKKYAKRGTITEETMREDGQDLGKKIAHAIILQEQLAYFNHHATICFFIEMQYRLDKEKSDREFCNSVEQILKEYISNS